MNKKPKSIWPSVSGVIVIVLAVLAGAYFYWTTPLPDIEKASPNAWFGAAFLAGIVCGLFSEKHFAMTGLLVTLGFALAVIIRVIYDINFVDSSSHNLFPVEVVIWSMMAGVPAIAGSFLGNQVIQWLRKKFKRQQH